MGSINVERIKSLYVGDGLSGVEIARRLNLPIRQVYRLLERRGIPRRPIADSNALRFSRQPPSFVVKKHLCVTDRILCACGVMLYWAEGARHPKKHILDFANSDPAMVKIYLWFLRRICGVQEQRIRIYLYGYANQDMSVLKRFWSKVTAIPLRQFSKPYVRKDFRADKAGRMQQGLVHVRYSDKKLYLQFERWHREIVKELLGR